MQKIIETQCRAILATLSIEASPLNLLISERSYTQGILDLLNDVGVAVKIRDEIKV